MDETVLADSDYVEGNNWYDTPSRSRHQPPNVAPSPPPVNTEVAAAITVTDESSCSAAPQEVASSRLAASTSGFPPSVQLAATRRSTSAVPPVAVASHEDTPLGVGDVLSGADGQKTAVPHPPNVPSEATLAQPTPKARGAEFPVISSDAQDASHGLQPPYIKPGKESIPRGPIVTTSTAEKQQGGGNVTLLSKKELKRRARKEKQRLAERERHESTPLGGGPRTSLPAAVTHPSADGTIPVSPEPPAAQAAQDASEEQPACHDTEARPSPASHSSHVSPPPKSVEQAVPSEQAQRAGQSRSPPFPIPSQPERKLGEVERSPSAASTRVTPKTEAADGPRTLLAGFRSEYVRISVAIVVVHRLLNLRCIGLLLAISQSGEEG